MRVLSPRGAATAAIALCAVTAAIFNGNADASTEFGCNPLAAVTALNSAPLATDDEAWVKPGSVIRVEVLGNDVDFDEDELFVESATQPSSGSATIEGHLIAFVADEVEGLASFNYRVTDAGCGFDVGTVRITVTKEDEPVDKADPPEPVTSVPDFTG